MRGVGRNVEALVMIYRWLFQSPCEVWDAKKSLQNSGRLHGGFNPLVGCGLQLLKMHQYLYKLWFQSPYGVWVATKCVVVKIISVLFQFPCGLQLILENVEEFQTRGFQSPCGVWVATGVSFQLNHLMRKVSIPLQGVGCNQAISNSTEQTSCFNPLAGCGLQPLSTANSLFS